MKKVVLIIGVVFTLAMLTSCTDNSLEQIERNEKQTVSELAIDPSEACPPNDRNCNGIPDDQE